MPSYIYGQSEKEPLTARTRQEAAWEVVGQVDWIDEHEGYCKCPGATLHTAKTGTKDTRIHIEPGRAPTIHCFHHSCQPMVEAANHQLRSMIGRIEAGETGTGGGLPRSFAPTAPKESSRDWQREAAPLQSNSPWIQSFSLNTPEELPETQSEHFLRHLALFAPDDLIWHGDVFETKRIHRRDQWVDMRKPSGQFISHCTFVPGADGRKNEFAETIKYLVVESDELSKTDQKARLAWLQQWAGWDLRLVVDTAGKSLHGWFAWPRHLSNAQIKALLLALKCDVRLMTASQPCRVAGAMRNGNMQHIIWQGEGHLTEPKQWDALIAVPDISMSDESGREWAVDDLLAYAVDADPNTLLGRRWLCRKQSLQVVGESGIGKSSLVMQMAVTWALGLPFFGITPVRAMRVLVVQRENDEGDMAEELQGITRGMGLDRARINELKAHLKIIQNNTGTGMGWALWLERKVMAHRADIVFADPLLSFAEGEISRQSDATTFCRHQIQPMLNRTGAAMIAAHHTGKPKAAKDKADSFGAGSYLGLGSSEFTNWFRAVMTLTRQAENIFILRAEKRGQRAGLRKTTGEDTTEIKLRHSRTHGVFWEQIHESTIGGEDGVEFRSSSLGEEYRAMGFNTMPPMRHDKRNPLQSEVLAWIAAKMNFGTRDETEGTFSPDIAAANKLWESVRRIGANKHHKSEPVVTFDNATKLWKGVDYAE